LRQPRLLGWLGLVGVLGLLGGGLVVLQARLLSETIASVFLEGAGLDQAAWALCWLLAIIGLRALLAAGSEVSANRAALEVKSRLRNHFLAHLFRLGPAYVRGERTGELVTLAVEGVEALDAYFSQYLPQLILAALVPLVILVVVFPLDLLTGLVLLLTAPLIPLFMRLIGSLSEAVTHRQWTALTRLGAHFLDTLQGLTTLKLLGQGQARASSLAQSSERYRQATMDVLRVTFLSALVLELVATLSTAVVAVEIGLRLLNPPDLGRVNGSLDYRAALFILVLAPEFYLPLRTLGMRFHAGIAGVTAAKKIAAVLDERVVTGLAGPSGGALTRWSAPTIRFENVSYAYPEGGQDKRPALVEVSFEIGAGEHVALVGSSGAGKSTVLQLLLGFILSDRGRILVDGQPLAEIPATEWRQRLAWAPQLPYLFNDTLQANLCLGRPGASPDQIERAVRLAHLDDLVRSLPEGLQTRLGENAARLSGGQAQRLALGRAFLKNAPLLLLDEPGANLDPQQEALLQDSINELSRGRTVLTIAHRLNLIRRADRVILLEQGRVAASGSHQELLAHSDPYAKLWSKYA
jgi:ATP-binding cassette subfamily C protein CydD